MVNKISSGRRQIAGKAALYCLPLALFMLYRGNGFLAAISASSILHKISDWDWGTVLAAVIGIVGYMVSFI
jgi:uncharacterized membrane protein